MALVYGARNDMPAEPLEKLDLDAPPFARLSDAILEWVAMTCADEAYALWISNAFYTPKQVEYRSMSRMKYKNDQRTAIAVPLWCTVASWDQIRWRGGVRASNSLTLLCQSAYQRNHENRTLAVTRPATGSSE